MKKTLILTLFLIVAIICADGKKSFKTSGSRGSGRKTNYNPHPAPTSLSYPQASAPKQSAPKPTLFGWQEKPAKNAQTIPSQASKSSGHSYPSSQTGLSGNNQPKQPGTFQENVQRSSGQSHSYPSGQSGLSGNQQPKQPGTFQENIQRSSATQNLNGQQNVPHQTNNQPGHAYPASTGLSGNPGSSYPQQSAGGHSYPQGNSYQQAGSGLSGAGAAPPPYPGYNKPYNGGTNQGSNYGNAYHPQGPPPPYSNPGGYGGHSYNTGYGQPMPVGFGQQSPGFFGNYANNNGNRGFGGLSRGGSALTGVGIAGAGVGTLLTGLALWNLARSTGQRHHTVVYDNRGQPVAVAPATGTETQVDSFLADLVNCTLTISNSNNTEVLAIPCAIATSFSPDAEIKDSEKNQNPNDDTKCTITVINKSGREFMTTIPCSTLLNTAAENNVTEPPLMVNNSMDNVNISTGGATEPQSITQEPSAMPLVSAEDSVKSANLTTANCTEPQPGEIRDPINPCFALTHNVTVLPLSTSEKYQTDNS